jgi:hypothetical protein
MSKVTIAGNPPPEELVQFRAKLATLKYAGPKVHVHVLPAQGPGQVHVLAWRDASDKQETDTPSFSTMGTVNQAFMSLEAWFSKEGWLEGASPKG